MKVDDDNFVPLQLSGAFCIGIGEFFYLMASQEIQNMYSVLDILKSKC